MKMQANKILILKSSIALQYCNWLDVKKETKLDKLQIKILEAYIYIELEENLLNCTNYWF